MATDRSDTQAGGPSRGATHTARHIADELRSRIDRGVYGVGQLLPTQQELKAEFGVSRDTVQRAMIVLRNENWVETRQGGGSRVIRTRRLHTSAPRAAGAPGPVGFGLLLAEAFESEHVTLDAYCLTTESLAEGIKAQAIRVMSGEVSPQSVTVRLLLPSRTPRPAFPSAAGAPDDLRPYERWSAMVDAHLGQLRDRLDGLRRDGYVPAAKVLVGRVPITPTHKLYLFNRTSALHGLYVLERRTMTLADGDEVDALDVLGLQSTLFHYEKSEDEQAQGSMFVSSSQIWFDSYWQQYGPAE
ncbi:winged helix-turn-helix domain-containing protein [Streptomyces sp. NPDC059651]|uniref:winged helix-turn-helix domain-containing protein n=1 Tax=unclassified Streptomyces TaxID=2593676 RepID=UPI00367FDC71